MYDMPNHPTNSTPPHHHIDLLLLPLPPLNPQPHPSLKVPRTLKIHHPPRPHALPSPLRPPLRPSVPILQLPELRPGLGLVHRRQPALQHLQPHIAPPQAPPHVHRCYRPVVLVPLVHVRPHAPVQHVRRQPAQRVPRERLRWTSEVREFGRVDAGEPDVDLLGGRNPASDIVTSSQRRNYGPYRPVFQLVSLRRHLPTGHPSPSREAAPGRVEESEVVAVADARHAAEETPAAEEAGLDVGCFGDAPEIGSVEAD